MTRVAAGVAVVVSVPHAGRCLPPAIAARARVGLADLARLTDGWSDMLAAPLVEAGAGVVMARLARAVVDCNRDPADLSPADAAPDLQARLGAPGEKARAGLGVVATRLAGVGPLWRGAITAADLDQRLALGHAPYHAALAARLAEVRARHGHALLIDLHSMPRLTGARPAQIVVGDAMGASAPSGFAARLADHAAAAGYRSAVNAPYAGGAIVRRHASLPTGIAAVQIEVDRSLYLAADGRPHLDGAMRLGEWVRAAAMMLAAQMGHPAGQWADGTYRGPYAAEMLANRTRRP